MGWRDRPLAARAHHGPTTAVRQRLPTASSWHALIPVLPSAPARRGPPLPAPRPQPMEIYVDDEAKLTLHGLVQHYVMLNEARATAAARTFLHARLHVASLAPRARPLPAPRPRRPQDQKNRKLNDLLDALDFNQVVIFVKSVARARELNRLLNECNFPSTAIHAGEAARACMHM